MKVITEGITDSDSEKQEAGVCHCLKDTSNNVLLAANQGMGRIGKTCKNCQRSTTDKH